MSSRNMPIRAMAGLLVSCLSAQSLAAVDLVVGGGAVDDPATAAIEVFPGSTLLSLGLTSDGGPIGNGGGLAFDFQYPTGLTLQHWAWDAIFPWEDWGMDDGLPSPAVVSFAPALPIPAAPDSVTVATVLAQISAPVGASLNLPTGLQVFDLAGNNLATTGASASIRFDVVPEPATVCILVVGMAVGVRRRGQLIA